MDIGSKTKDVVYVQNRFLVESKSITIEKAMVKWIKEIQRDMKVQTGKDIPEHEVIKILLKEENHLPIVYAELINGMMREKICLLELELAEAAGSSASLTSYVKRVLEEHFRIKMEITGRQEFHEQMLSVIREEMQTQGMKLVGALLAGIGTVGVPAEKDEAELAVTELPEVCEELPEELNGVLTLSAKRNLLSGHGF